MLLVGFMGSGKSSVGRFLAREVGWRFLDLDGEIERAEGRDIPTIFREQGEEAFRAVERRVADDLLTRDGIVLASGGGWPCRPGRLERLPPGTLSVWLRVSADTALDRTAAQAATRPLLQVEDRAARIRELLAEREPFYRQAHLWVDTELESPPGIARRLAGRLRSDPERPLRR